MLAKAVSVRAPPLRAHSWHWRWRGRLLRPHRQDGLRDSTHRCLLGRGDDGSSISLSPALPPLTPEHESKAPVFPREQEARASDGPPATPLIGATPQSSLLSPDLLSQQDRDLTVLPRRSRFTSPVNSRKGRRGGGGKR